MFLWTTSLLPSICILRRQSEPTNHALLGTALSHQPKALTSHLHRTLPATMPATPLHAACKEKPGGAPGRRSPTNNNRRPRFAGSGAGLAGPDYRPETPARARKTVAPCLSRHLLPTTGRWRARPVCASPPPRALAPTPTRRAPSACPFSPPATAAPGADTTPDDLVACILPCHSDSAGPSSKSGRASDTRARP